MVKLNFLRRILIFFKRSSKMSKKDTAIYYSGATDVTGKALAEALKITGDRKKPAGKKLVIGWGCKNKEKMTFPTGTKFLNHPNAILGNRNKFKALQVLDKAKVAVAPFVTSDYAKAELAKTKGKISFPVVGRKNHHQGGKGFWFCANDIMLKEAIAEGAQYFQNFMDIVDEYRLHVFGDKVIYAQKKVKRTNMEEAFKSQHGDKIKALAEKNNTTLDQTTLDYVLAQMGKRIQPTADMLIRSNMKGWKFSSLKLSNVKPDLSALAVAAVKAVGLDFGAVDCCSTKNGAFIIEINSGPGLEKTALDKYIASFETAIADTFKVTKAAPDKSKKQAATKAVTGVAGTTGSVKQQLQAKAQLFSEMVEASDEAEAEVLDSVWKKMIASGN
jgi:glutathione synthase/RimK-type ligase-like ATP-grasp enzyme